MSFRDLQNEARTLGITPLVGRGVTANSLRRIIAEKKREIDKLAIDQQPTEEVITKGILSVISFEQGVELIQLLYDESFGSITKELIPEYYGRQIDPDKYPEEPEEFLHFLLQEFLSSDPQINFLPSISEEGGLLIPIIGKFLVFDVVDSFRSIEEGYYLAEIEVNIFAENEYIAQGINVLLRKWFNACDLDIAERVKTNINTQLKGLFDDRFIITLTKLKLRWEIDSQIRKYGKYSENNPKLRLTYTIVDEESLRPSGEGEGEGDSAGGMVYQKLKRETLVGRR